MRRILKMQWADINGTMGQEVDPNDLEMSEGALTGRGKRYGDVIESYLLSWPDEYDWTLDEFCSRPARYWPRR